MIDPAALINRVRKTQRHLGKWARREGLEAYRLYDRDMSEFPLQIDRYRDWLHVQVLEKRRPLTDKELDAIRDRLATDLEIPVPQVVLKQRRRQRGLAQYEKLTSRTPSFTVEERGLRFEVNLGRYLDTGCFSTIAKPGTWYASALPAKPSLISLPIPAASPFTPQQGMPDAP